MEIVKAFNDNNLNTNITIIGTFERPLFRASDVGAVLDITKIRNTINDFNESEKVAHTVGTLGGNQIVTFLTTKGLYKLLMKSRKPIAEKFQNWICDVVEEIRLSGQYKLEEQLKEKEEIINTQMATLQIKNGELHASLQLLEKTQEENMQLLENVISKVSQPVIYIYNIDIRKTPSELKIGFTTDHHARIKPYKQVCKFGRLEFYAPVCNENINTVENYIHSLLTKFLIKDEVFRIDVDDAKHIVLNVINLSKIINNPCENERKVKLARLCENEIIIADNVPNPKLSTNSISTQTDCNIDVPISTPFIFDNPELNEKFNIFINEMCIVRHDVEIASTLIEGQYRIWSKSAKKEVFHALKHYLSTRFKPSRLHQDKNQVVHGYVGITLKEITYKKSITPCDAETFIFHACTFSPQGKVLHTSLLEEYIKWKKDVGKQISIHCNNFEQELKELKSYLNSNNNVLNATLWSNNTTGMGYYGINLRSEECHHKITSSTGKRVEKREVATNALLGTWETISKAAEVAHVSSSKMSLSIKNKVIFNDDYYYCTA
jgi:prophage antirepressor-like protein